MRYKADDFSSHEYEVKNLYMKDSSFKTIFFYLRAGEPVDVKIESVLKKTNLWIEPTKSQPERKYHIFFEVQPRDEIGISELYMSDFTVKMEEYIA